MSAEEETRDGDGDEHASHGALEPTSPDDAQDDSEQDDSEQDEGAQDDADKRSSRWWARLKLPLLIYGIVAAVYVATLGPRLFGSHSDNHYVHLAESFLHGTLAQQGNPPGTNDWACYDTVERDACPNNRFRFPDQERYKWYVSFPPFPAAVIAPLVAVMGVDGTPDRLFWALIAALGPALFYGLLRRLREEELSERSVREDLGLTALFAFGTVLYFVAVQGTVWFAAQAVATPLLVLYLSFGIGAKRPALAGLMLGLAFMCRPTTALLAIFFGLEALRKASEGATWRDRVRSLDKRAFARDIARFSAPILLIGAVAMWMNFARFDDPFEFGHTYLQIRWRGRIERWGLFNYHYFAKNLAVFTSSLPWLSIEAPYLMISRHGLALWVTTPAIAYAIWAKRSTALTQALWAALIPVALLNLAYQNSGWVQFGYRFALDYMPLLLVLIALSGRRFGKLFALMLAWSIAVNTFGAITFDRAPMFYNRDLTQEVMFQPD